MTFFFKWTDKIIRWCLYGMMFSMSFGNSCVEIFAGAAIMLLLMEWFVLAAQGIRNKNIRQAFHAAKIYAPLAVLIVIYIGWNLLSVFFSIDFRQSAGAFFSKLLQGILTFFCCVFHIRKKRHVRIFLGMFLAGAMIAAVNGIFQWIFGWDFVRGSDVSLTGGRRVSGSFRHPNVFGGYLAVVIPLVFSLVFCNRGKGGVFKEKYDRIIVPVMLWMLLIFSLTALGLTFSRGAWLGMVLGLLFLGIFRKRIFVPAVGLIIIFTGVFYAASFSARGSVPKKLEVVYQEVREKGISRVIEKDFLADAFTQVDSGRNVFWRDALRIAEDHPVVGSGLNTYSDVLRTYPRARHGWYAHNCYLQMAAEIGFVGLGLFLAVLAAFFIMSVRAAKRLTDPFLSAVVYGCLAALTAFLTHSFFDTAMYVTQIGSLHWILMGLVTGIFRMENR
jgi:putative inorganic carbon (HCO3(-)) transporter